MATNVTSLSGAKGRIVRSGFASPLVPQVHLLGAIRATGANGEDILPRPKKTQAVLAYLCLAEAQRVSRSRIAGIVWDRVSELQARDSLRHALTELERIGAWRLDLTHDMVRLDVSGYWIDAFESPEEADRLLDGLHGISSSFDQWLLGERVRYENRWQGRLEAELDDLVDGAAPPEHRAAAARRLLNFMPTHEAAVRSLMAAFEEMGDRAQAVREFERFRQVVGERLGIGPSQQTTAAYSAIRLASPPRPTRTGRLATGDVVGPFRTAGGLPPEREPSIAVLPFRDLSAHTPNDYVAKGLVEDLVEALSRVPGLFVVSRLSAAALSGQDRLPEEIGEALGVRYLLSGSIRAVGGQLRLTVELTDTAAGRPLWNSRFDEEFTDLLVVQDRLTDTVIRSVAPNVRAAELRRSQIKRPESRDAYDLLLRAQQHMHEPSRAEFEAAEALFDLAIAREPGYSAALTWRAYWHVMRVGQGWSPDPDTDAAQADHYAKLAIACASGEPMAYAVRGHVATFLCKDFDTAFEAFEAALNINPNCARAWLWNANAHAYMGRGGTAVEKINRAMALSPYDPLVCAYSGGASLAYLADRQYERSIEFALRCIRQNRSYSAAYRLLIVALVLAGRKSDAHGAVNQLLLLEPRFTVEENRRRFPGSAYTFGELYSDALATAGVPFSA